MGYTGNFLTVYAVGDDANIAFSPDPRHGIQDTVPEYQNVSHDGDTAWLEGTEFPEVVRTNPGQAEPENQRQHGNSRSHNGGTGRRNRFSLFNAIQEAGLTRVERVGDSEFWGEHAQNVGGRSLLRGINGNPINDPDHMNRKGWRQETLADDYDRRTNVRRRWGGEPQPLGFKTVYAQANTQDHDSGLPLYRPAGFAYQGKTPALSRSAEPVDVQTYALAPEPAYNDPVITEGW